jgi:hypothetical protein
MRTACRILVLLMVLGVSTGLALPGRALIQGKSVTCVLTDQRCLRCHPYLAQQCNYYDCSDGSTRITCGGCTSSCIEP